MIDKQDAYEGALDAYSKSEKSKASSMGRDAFSVTPWTEANMNNCQSLRDALKTRPGTSPKQETTDMNLDDTAATNGHHDSVFARHVVQENGYGSPPDKRGSATTGRDMRHCQYEHNIHRERPKNFGTPVAADPFPKGDGGRSESDTRHCETWKIKDPSPAGERDCNKTGSVHSEVTKIVPLKPQRSKKSLNKENKGDANPQTKSQFDRGVFGAAGEATKSKDGPCEAGKRAGDNAVPQPATDVKENTGAGKYHGEGAVSHQQQTLLHQQIKRELYGQQEVRDCRGTTGQSQWTRGGALHEDHSQSSLEFKESHPSSSKFPTAPPRSLPLKTQWSRDRQSNVDSSHIHYRTPSQETAKRKQAVNHPPPHTSPNLFVHHWKVKHCMSFRRCRANLVFTI